MHTFDLSPSAPNFARPAHASRRYVFLVIVVAMHLMLLLTVLRWHPETQAVKSENSSLIIQWFPIASRPERALAESDKSKVRRNSLVSQPKLPSTTPNTSQGLISDPAKPTISNTETSQAPSVKPPLDPFDQNATNITDKLRNDAGKVFKQIEAEQPIKRWLLTKKELTPMEKFARDALGATPAREVQTQEEMRPDGSRMTRVKTPRGEFCVVGPQPGRPYDIKGPEHRVMSCPIYF